MLIGEYEVIIENNKRYYIEDLSVRDFTLECTTPYLLKIDDVEIKETTWVELLRSLSFYLYEHNKGNVSRFLNFKCNRSKAEMFSNSKKGVNFKKVVDNLYVNCNHTALHACWFLQDMLKFFNIDLKKVMFVIHRTPYSEPDLVRKFFIDKFEKDFGFFLETSYNKDSITQLKIIKNIVNYLNPILNGISKSYDDFRLFDDFLTFSNYKEYVVKEINNLEKLQDKVKKSLLRYCRYLTEYYRTIL